MIHHHGFTLNDLQQAKNYIERNEEERDTSVIDPGGGGSLSLYIYHQPGNLFTLDSNRVHRFTTYIDVVLLEP